jgi:hypothetical protein
MLALLEKTLLQSDQLLAEKRWAFLLIVILSVRKNGFNGSQTSNCGNRIFSRENYFSENILLY